MKFLAEATFSEYSVIAGMVTIVAAFLKAMHFMVNKFVKYVELRDLQIRKESKLNRRTLRSVRRSLDTLIERGCKYRNEVEE